MLTVYQQVPGAMPGTFADRGIMHVGGIIATANNVSFCLFMMEDCPEAVFDCPNDEDH